MFAMLFLLSGVLNFIDNCKTVKNADQMDRDKDGAGDVCDNCPDTYNPKQVSRRGICKLIFHASTRLLSWKHGMTLMVLQLISFFLHRKTLMATDMVTNAIMISTSKCTCFCVLLVLHACNYLFLLTQ